MTAVLAVLLAFGAYALAYKFYAGFLSRRIFELDPGATTPAHELRDDVDYVPTNRYILFGHHWASITGLSPMLGPAIAVIWGWFPAMLWVVLGAIFFGCVHDFSALVISIRARGESVGKVAEGIIGARAKVLFLFLIFFGIALAMGVFTIAIAGLIGGQFGSVVIPSAGLMVVAMGTGWILNKRGGSLVKVSIPGFLSLFVLMYLGYLYPVEGISPESWKWILLGYGFLASVLPVWSLLQPRDFLNSLLLYLGLGAAFIGFFIMKPEFGAPMINAHPEGAPPMFPYVFITIACGAISGFHGLVASGTTAKQLNRETDAKFIGYGGMMGESMLGLLAVLATAAGFVSSQDRSPKVLWNEHYAHWHQNDAASALGHFIDGAARFVAQLGVDLDACRALVAVLVVSFALTTLDSATRLLRYNVSEIGETFGIKPFGNRYLASLIAVVAIGFFAFYEVDGEPMGRVLWGLFGTTNQLLAALTLMTVSFYLWARGKQFWWTAVPALFMMATTLVAMIRNLRKFSGNWTFEEGASMPLFLVGTLLLVLSVWLVLEAVLRVRGVRE